MGQQRRPSLLDDDDEEEKSIDNDSMLRIYQSQLAHIDEILHDEIDAHDPIITCDAYLNMKGNDGGNFVDPVAITDTFYQEISWSESADKPDKCLTLDDTLQICNSYRPQYHEYFVHFPASFLPEQNMKRALFVGGGDSMLLHELLKYPSLELIVGLELDQTVVRESLQHFFTRPYFELYPRVQWWFGDAARSLLLLPKEWYGTFDLVMVDLSETVMSKSVSGELDILKALALLLNPKHGIFVKNEKYLHELSDIFDHVIQIYLPDTPLLCDQDWVLGSYGIDFLHPQFDGLLREVSTLHYRPKEDVAKNHYQLIKDYAKNDIDIMSHCANDGEAVESKKGVNTDAKDKEGAKFGVFLAIEAEKTSRVSGYNFNLEEALVVAINGVGDIQILSSETFHFGGHFAVMILLHEGYIIGRSWPNLQYCAFDVVFWSRFHLLDATRNVLLQAVGSDEHAASSYRVIVGGMHYNSDTTTWREDLAAVGPKKTTIAKCQETVTPDNLSHPRIEKADMLSNSQIVIQESLALLPSVSDETSVTVVFCGVKQPEQECESFKAVSSSIDRMIVVWSCTDDSLDEISETTNLQLKGILYLCGNQKVDHVLRKIVSQLGKIHLVIIDADVPATSVIDLANALTQFPLNKDDSFLNGEALVILPKLDRIGEYFLEICRLNLFHDLLRIAIVSLDQTSGVKSERDHQLGYLTLGNPLFLAQLAKVMESISEHTTTDAQLLTMKSSTVKPQSSYSPHHYTMFDYNEAPGMKQYSEQMPMGKQTLLHMKFKNALITFELLKERAERLLMIMNVTSSELISEQAGDGIIIYSIFIDGHMTVAWNGRQSIDMNIFTYDETIPHKDLFDDIFMKPISSKSTLTLWEEQPRGVNRVVNFSKDIVAIPGCVDRFILCDKLSELGECEKESEKRWMSLNCPLACDMCPG